jgi:radical SAM protein with 4Fe4S-binding SPASM domain
VNDPQYADNLKKDIMTFAVFKKFIDDIRDFPARKIIILRFIGNGEPLVNQQLPEFIRYAKQNKVTDKIEVTTNATLLTPELSDKLIDAGLDILKISLEGTTDEKFLAISGVIINVKHLYENIKYFYEHKKKCIVYIKTTNLALATDTSREQFFSEWGCVCDNIFVENICSLWPEYDKTDGVGIEKKRYEPMNKCVGNHVCVQPFKLMAVTADGEVFPCCADWQRKLSLGNLNDLALSEIWNGERLRNLRVALLRQEMGKPCAVCKFSGVSDTDNIDDYTEAILRRIV